jgi:hypothetical protein
LDYEKFLLDSGNIKSRAHSFLPDAQLNSTVPLFGRISRPPLQNSERLQPADAIATNDRSQQPRLPDHSGYFILIDQQQNESPAKAYMMTKTKKC